jgi:hypothetical protein
MKDQTEQIYQCRYELADRDNPERLFGFGQDLFDVSVTRRMRNWELDKHLSELEQRCRQTTLTKTGEKPREQGRTGNHDLEY